MTGHSHILTWTLPAAGDLRGADSEGFVTLCEDVHADARLLHRRSFTFTQQVKGKPVKREVAVRFDGAAARITDAGGVPYPPGFRPPAGPLREALEGVAHGVNAAIAALTDPDPARAVDLLFRDGPGGMSLAPVRARGPVGRVLFGARFDRGRNRAALTGFLKDHGPDPAPQEPPEPGDPPQDDTPADPWLDRLQATLAILPRLSETEATLTLDDAARTVALRLRCAAPATRPLPGFAAQLDPPGLSPGSARHVSAEAQCRAIAICEVTRALHLLLYLFPQPGWTLRAAYDLPAEQEEDGDRRLHADEIGPDSGLIDRLTP